MMDDILLDRQKLTGNIFFEVTPIKNLVWHAELGYDISSSKGERYKPMVDLGGWVRSSNESSIQKNSSTFWQLKNYVTYSGNIGDKHHYTAMVGQECWESSYDFTSVFNSGLPSDEVHNPALGTGTPTINAGFGSSSMASFFTRLTYNYADRYLGTYTYRYDGSSNFGPENRWAGFHSLAASWRFSNETFFEPLKKVISNGKLRLGWGQTGNANIGGYAWGTSMNRMPSGLGMGYRPSNIPNTSIKWESQEQWNVGVDLGFLHDRINLTVEWYKKTSSDMLMPLQLPSYMGTSGNGSSALAAPKGNYGDIENTGFEISLNTHPITGKFEWDSDFQISFNKNKLKGLAGTANAQIVGYGQWTDVVSVSSVGESLYNFYGFVCDGVYKDLEDLQTSPKPAKYPANGVFDRTNTVWVGDVKYKDISGPDGVPDGVIDDYDKTNIGSPMPKFTFGWTNTFRYKNFDLSVFINGSYGNKVYNYLSMKLTHMNSPWTNQLNAVNGRAQLVPINPNKVYEDGTMWYNDVSNVMVANPGASIPRATINDPNDNDRISDRYIEDGSYIRLKNISLGYTFPKKTIDKLGLSNLRIYANIQNLLTITGYATFQFLIPAACLLYVLSAFWRRDLCRELARKLLIFGIAIVLVIPVSVKASDLIEDTYRASIEQTLETAKDTTAEVESGVQGAAEETDQGFLEGLFSKVTDSISGVASGISEKVGDMVNSFLEALAVMLVTSCVIPILVLLFFVWIIKILIGIEIPINYRGLSNGEKPLFSRANKTKDPL